MKPGVQIDAREVFAPGVRLTPWWWEAAPPRGHAPERLPGAADVVVVGSGFTGLSAALTLARAGRDVVVLDAEAAGFGASTRNGGQVGSGNQKFSVARLGEIHGREKAHALVREGTAMLENIVALVQGEEIRCHFRRVGRFRGAAAPSHYETMARDLEDLHRVAGVEYAMVPRAGQHAEVASDLYHGGSLLPHDASLHPGLYHAGLLERAESAGARVVPHTRVIGLRRERQRVAVSTERGEMSAGAAIVAVNGYVGAELPDWRRRLVPVISAIIATEPLDPDVAARLIPNERVVGSTARVIHYYRLSPDRRCLLFGGRGHQGRGPGGPDGFLHLYREMLRVFPQLGGVKITHCWSGRLAYTFDGMPHLGERDGIHYANGYCGSGVARSTWFGRKIALKVLGDPEGRSEFDDLPFVSHPLHWAAPLGVRIAEAWMRIRDRLES